MMRFSFTPQAVQRLNAILQEKQGDLAYRIQVQRTPAGVTWKMTLEPRTAEAVLVDGLPLHLDTAAHKALDGLIIDWVMTPDGPGLGVYDRYLNDRQ